MMERLLEKQIETERRLTILETRQAKILETLVEIKENQNSIWDEQHIFMNQLSALNIKDTQDKMRKDINDIKNTLTKAGGIIIGFSMVGAAITWLLSHFKTVFSFFSTSTITGN